MEQPARFGDYTLLKEIAAGGVTETFLARRSDDATPGGEFVIKRLRPHLAAEPAFVALCEREARTAARLDHRGVASVFGFGEVPDEGYFIAMEYVWGEDLRRVAERGMTAGRFLPVALAVRAAADVADALGFIHEQRGSDGEPLNLVHGDVSPANVMVTFDGGVKLVDFGLALNEDASQGLLQGKYAYMSPEQVEGANVDGRSDIFSLGIVLYELTARKRLFKGHNRVSTLKLVAEAQVSPPTESIPDYPPALEAIVLRALARDPKDRYDDAYELHYDLLGLLEALGEPAEPSELADYVRSLFADRVVLLEELLGEGYAGPTDRAAAMAHSQHSISLTRPVEPDAADIVFPRLALPKPPAIPLDDGGEVTARQVMPMAPAREEEQTPVPGSPVVGSDDTPPAAQPVARSEAPPPPPPPKAPIEQVQSVSHTLRRVLPDAFEQTAERSRQMTIVIGVIIVAVIATGVVWYGSYYKWPWEGISDNRPTEVEVPPLPPRELPSTILARIETDPPGAGISINGVISNQAAPGDYEMVPNTTNTIGVYLDGYESQVTDIEVGDTGPPEGIQLVMHPVTMPADWAPPPPDPQADPNLPVPTTARGRTQVTTDPTGATILLNGNQICQSPCSLDVDANQEQHITARRFSYLDTETTTVAPEFLAENDTRFVQLTLRPVPDYSRIYTYFEIDSYPDRVPIRVNGALLGHTPVRFQELIDDVYRIELQAQGYQPWARTFYPSAGRFELRPILERRPTGPGRLTVQVDAPDMPGTVIYVQAEGRGARELGQDAVDNVELESGDYQVTLSYTPPPETGERRRRSRLPLSIPAGQHVMASYGWDGSDFVLVERTERPF